MTKILIVEDNRDLNNVYQLILKREGYEVKTAFDGNDGLRCLRSFQPRIILLDLIMPRKTGVEFLQEADLANNAPDSKVLVFTNLDHGLEMNAAMANGATRCAIKAKTTPEGLVKIVQEMLGENNA